MPMQAERRKQHADRVLRLAETQPIVAQYLKVWRGQGLSWEEALVGMVVNLAGENQQLLKLLTRADPSRPGHSPLEVRQ